MSYKNRITSDPKIRGGRPCIRGTRIAVSDILEYLAGGMAKAELMNDFPDLVEEDILAALEFATHEAC